MDHFPDQLESAKKQLFHLIEGLSSAANVKEVNTGKYILCNYHAIEALELDSVNDLIGQTTDDIYSDHGIYNKDLDSRIIDWRSREPEKIKAFEIQAKLTKRPVNLKRPYFTVNGLIRFESMTKIPILDHANQNVIAMLTSSQDLTFQLGLFRLCQLYQDYYPERKAIQQLLKHLGIDLYFSELPTLREIQVLFAIRRHSHHAYVAKLLQLSPVSIQRHISRLHSKLSALTTLQEILIHLRNIPIDERGQYYNAYT